IKYFVPNGYELEPIKSSKVVIQNTTENIEILNCRSYRSLVVCEEFNFCNFFSCLLPREVTTPEKKDQLLKQACDLLKGRVKEFTFAHDTVRVLECILREGAETHRNLLFEELKNDILPLSKSKYGKTKEQKVAVMKTFHGQIVQLIRHAEASEVVELAFNECANAAQRFEFVQEFFNPSYKFFKTQDVSSLEELFEKEPSKKASIIQHMKEELLKILDKTVIKHSMVHNVLWQFIRNADPESRAEVIESVRDVVHEILHTKDGSRVGMHCDRKVIVRSMKTFVAKIAMEEHGHMVLLALFDCLDDTAIMEKIVIKELVSQLFELSQNIHGKKVLIYLLNPRDPHYIHPDVINILKQGDGNKTSKKDPKIRSSQLKSMIATPLLDMIKSNISKLYIENSFCLFALVILQHTVGNRKEAFQSIVDLVVEPYTTENKKHAIENPGSHFMFKQLITRDKEESNDNVKFSEVLIETVPKLVFKSWMDCNRGAFLLVGLLETELPTVVERIKQELDGCLSSLKKKSYAGANILIKNKNQNNN
ncbi:UNVERIFIED_CONTAM: pum3, partial [Trichonephila clavipes]